MHSSTLCGVILGQWLREVCESFGQHPDTQTQSVYTVLGNLMHFLPNGRVRVDLLTFVVFMIPIFCKVLSHVVLIHRDAKGWKVSGNFGNFPWKVSGNLKGWSVWLSIFLHTNDVHACYNDCWIIWSVYDKTGLFCYYFHISFFLLS